MHQAEHIAVAGGHIVGAIATQLEGLDGAHAGRQIVAVAVDCLPTGHLFEGEEASDEGDDGDGGRPDRGHSPGDGQQLVVANSNSTQPQARPLLQWNSSANRLDELVALDRLLFYRFLLLVQVA